MVYPRVALHTETQGEVSFHTSQPLPKMEPNRACPCIIPGYISQELLWGSPQFHHCTSTGGSGSDGYFTPWEKSLRWVRVMATGCILCYWAGIRVPDHRDQGMPDHRDHPEPALALRLPMFPLRWPSLTFLAIDLSHLSKSHVIADAQAHFAVCCSQNTRDSSHITSTSTQNNHKTLCSHPANCYFTWLTAKGGAIFKCVSIKHWLLVRENSCFMMTERLWETALPTL